MDTTTDAILEELFSSEEARVFAVLDGAAVGDLLTPLYEYQPEFECLYRGELKPDIAEVAPYLVRLTPESPFTEWVIGQGWGKHWGVFAVIVDRRRGERRGTRVDIPVDRRREERRRRVGPLELSDIRRHFRRFLIVHDPDGKPLYFRYYDPRVLRVYLPTCTAEELQTIFGPIDCFVLADEDPATALRFRLDNGTLRQEKVPLKPR